MSFDDILLNCRLCQVKCGTITIACDQDFIKNVYECSGIKFNDEYAEMFPKFVCSECYKNIDFICNYLKNIKQIDARLKEIILNTNVITPNSKQFRCPECRKTYVKYTSFQMHKKSHSTLVCFTCDFIFDDQSEKHRHNCQSSTSKNEILKSDLNYGQSLAVRNNSIASNDNTPGEKTVNPKSEDEESRLKGFICKICQEIFVLRVDFSLHKKVHKTTLTCKWENCGKICSSPYSLKTHEMKHEGRKRFLCVTCGKSFLTKNSLNCHEKIHLDIKGYVCKICNIGFSVRSNLRAHEKKHHEGVRFYCSQCTRAFITKCSLDRHERIHAGVKEYQCQKCPSAFYTSKELQKHQRYHQGLRQHKCEQCFKTFFEKHHLTVHLRSHTGERPYTCKIAGCNKSYAESQKLTRHVRAKHTTQ